jgi:putative DNA primase/helicase
VRFEQALIAAGLIPHEIAADGRWRRCKTVDKPRKRNGAYKLAIGGDVGFWRNWALDDGPQVWRDDAVRPVDTARLARQLEAARKRERDQRIAAMRGARAFWGDCKPLTRVHPYLERKRLSSLGCAGLRIHRDLLVVPVWHGQWVVSVQTITPDGEKRFWPGAPVKAGAYVMERPGAALTAICEGLATGLAVFQSVRQARVVVAFDAGNLLPVVERLRLSGSVVICADNDHRTQERIGVNPGVEKATAAANSIGCGVAYPSGIYGSDWADALTQFDGDMPQRRIERQILSQARYVVPP